MGELRELGGVGGTMTVELAHVGRGALHCVTSCERDTLADELAHRRERWTGLGGDGPATVGQHRDRTPAPTESDGRLAKAPTNVRMNALLDPLQREGPALRIEHRQRDARLGPRRVGSLLQEGLELVEREGNVRWRNRRNAPSASSTPTSANRSAIWASVIGSPRSSNATNMSEYVFASR